MYQLLALCIDASWVKCPRSSRKCCPQHLLSCEPEAPDCHAAFTTTSSLIPLTGVRLSCSNAQFLGTSAFTTGCPKMQLTRNPSKLFRIILFEHTDVVPPETFVLGIKFSALRIEPWTLQSFTRTSQIEPAFFSLLLYSSAENGKQPGLGFCVFVAVSPQRCALQPLRHCTVYFCCCCLSHAAAVCLLLSLMLLSVGIIEKKIYTYRNIYIYIYIYIYILLICNDVY